MVSGTIRRVQKDFMETQRRVANGEIGEIVSAHIIQKWRFTLGHQKAARDGPIWSTCSVTGQISAGLSGDHIVEQFIHEIDVMNWYIGKNPVKAIGWGGTAEKSYRRSV